jgi:GntR family transcriptional regulator
MKKVDKNNSIPLHLQLSQIIKDMIESGELKSGNPILPERELCELQNVSRMTVNKAIVGLVNEGFLYRKQGKGTFVSERKEKYQYSSVKGFTEVMTQKGFEIRTDILSFELSTQPKYIREKLNIKDEKILIYKIERLRYIKDDPFALETVYIPHNMCSDLNKELLTNNSLYKVFKEKYNYDIKKATQTIEPIILSGEDSLLLKQDVGSLALRFQRNAYINDDIPIEYTISIFISDKYQYELLLT